MLFTPERCHWTNDAVDVRVLKKFTPAVLIIKSVIEIFLLQNKDEMSNG